MIDFIVHAAMFVNDFLLCMYICRCSVIPILADILSEAVKEKVQRIILATYRVSVISPSLLV